MRDIVIIAHNIRSTHNVGAIFRTAEGFGVTKIYLSGYTPYPATQLDTRLPHIADKLTAQIHKTALGAETTVPFSYIEEPDLNTLKQAGYTVVALEQDDRSEHLHQVAFPEKVALFLGEEVHGIEQQWLDQADAVVEIPMKGMKESFNVSVACGIALYAIDTAETV
jgi:tRNA G18 (ribose-2'-O)-methylase SpoU